MKVIIVRARAIDPAINKVAEVLGRRGFDVTLLVWDRQGTLKVKTNNNYKTIKFGLKAPYDRYTAIFYLPFWWIFELFFLLRNKCDVIQASDLDTLFPAILAKMLNKVKLFYTIYDFYANNLPDGKFQILRNHFRKMVAAIEKFGIGFTEVLFLVDECRYANVKGARINKVVYIYNSPIDCSDPKDWKRTENNNKLSIFYAGVISKSRGLECLIDAVDRLDDVKLTIAGIGPDIDVVKKAAQRSSNIAYLGQIPYQEVIKRTFEADVLFAMYDPIIPTNRYASPNKLFEAMMCRKPIIVNEGCSYSDIVRKENCGLIIPFGNIDELINAILRLKNDPTLSKQLGDEGRQAYGEKYSWNIMEERLIEAYNKYAKS